MRVGATLAVVAALFGLAACAPAPTSVSTTPPATRRPAPASVPVQTLSTTSWSAYVSKENARPGTPGWQITPAEGQAPGLSAYLDRVSVLPGQDVGLYVDASGPVRVRALRIGYYGGIGARTVWTGTVQATPQPARTVLDSPIPDAGGIQNTHTVVAPWHLTALLSTRGWPEGDYLLRLDAGQAARYVPLTVRSATAVGRLLVVSTPMTWQAYNSWGGGSLYDAVDGRPDAQSLAVSFDRPYADGYGSGRFLDYDQPILTLAEQAGLPLAWATDYDLAVDPGLLRGAVGLVIGGHAEYWTSVERTAVIHAVDAGTNLAIFGANTAYWRVRLAGATIGLPGQPDRRDGRPRIIVGTKNAAADPLARVDPAGAMTMFRKAPDPQPEELLTGMRYDCHPANAAWTVSDPSWWGYAGTGVHAGQQLPGVVGPESDRVYPSPDTPPSEIVSYTRYFCAGRPTAHTAVYWAARSGAGVFVAGTMRWPCATEVGCTDVPGTTTAPIVARVTLNVLAAFARPAAGRAHPPRVNIDQYWLPGSTTAVVLHGRHPGPGRIRPPHG